LWHGALSTGKKDMDRWFYLNTLSLLFWSRHLWCSRSLCSSHKRCYCRFPWKLPTIINSGQSQCLLWTSPHWPDHCSEQNPGWAPVLVICSHFHIYACCLITRFLPVSFFLHPPTSHELCL
jgi:hypothetical protein